MIRPIGLMLAAGMAAAAPAQASNVTARDPQSIVAALQKAGYQAKLTKDDVGDPMIESSSGGSQFIVFFMNCTGNRDCRTVQFYSGYSEYKGDHKKMNEWNRDNRFGRGYISDQGAARVEMDVDLDDGGMSPELFEDNIEYWVTVMSAFEKFIS